MTASCYSCTIVRIHLQEEAVSIVKTSDFFEENSTATAGKTLCLFVKMMWEVLQCPPSPYLPLSGFHPTE
jgi:hypothetical protein